MHYIFLLLIALFSLTAHAQIPCDDAYGQFCPEESGFGVGDCLKTQNPDLLSDNCKAFIAMNDACKDDILKHCPGKEYTGDTQVCLSDWTQASELSADCLASIPKKVAKERKLSAKEKIKAEKRRRTRKEAEKLAREF